MNFSFRFLIICILFIGCFNIQGHGQKRSPSYEAYINKYKNLAIQQQKEYKIPASIKIAQGLLETGAGTSRLARIGNNHFGIKCKEEWTGGRMYHDDDAVGECFRTYKTAEDSYLDHSQFLAYRKYYVSLFKLDLYDYKAWARGLQECGYATDKGYGQKLINIIEDYELYKLDKAKIATDGMYPRDDIYGIKINADEGSNFIKRFTNLRRNIYEVNGVHYIVAQEGDTYDFIAYDTRMKVKRLLKLNETTKEQTLKAGDNVFLQGKKKYASKGNTTHTVRAGDSMHKISQLYGMKLKSLYKLNNLKKDYTPKQGDIIKVRKK